MQITRSAHALSWIVTHFPTEMLRHALGRVVATPSDGRWSYGGVAPAMRWIYHKTAPSSDSCWETAALIRPVGCAMTFRPTAVDMNISAANIRFPFTPATSFHPPIPSTFHRLPETTNTAPGNPFLANSFELLILSGRAHMCYNIFGARTTSFRWPRTFVITDLRSAFYCWPFPFGP